MNNQAFSKIWIVIIIIFVVGGILVYQSWVPREESKLSEELTDQEEMNKTVSTEFFTYTKNDQIFSVSKSDFKVLNKFTASELRSLSKECGTNKSEQYFNQLLAHYFKYDNGAKYQFKYKGQTQDSGVWVITLIPNKPGYANVNDFKKDFDICAAGADKYPSLVSEKYLLFISSCGTGYDDGSGRPHGCDVVRDVVKPTIRLQSKELTDQEEVNKKEQIIEDMVEETKDWLGATETEVTDVVRKNVRSQPAYLIDAYSKNGKNYIDVDYVKWLHGEASIKAQVEDGECVSASKCYDYPNGYKRNRNPKIRTFEVSPSAPINVVGSIRFKLNGFGPKLSISFERFESVVSNIHLPAYLLPSPPFKEPKTFIYVDVLDNIVTKITEPYQQ